MSSKRDNFNSKDSLTNHHNNSNFNNNAKLNNINTAYSNSISQNNTDRQLQCQSQTPL